MNYIDRVIGRCVPCFCSRVLGMKGSLNEQINFK
jgi:hypothetical protein